MKREVDIGDVSKAMEIKYLAGYNKYHEEREDKEFWEHLWQEIVK